MTPSLNVLYPALPQSNFEDEPDVYTIGRPGGGMSHETCGTPKQFTRCASNSCDTRAVIHYHNCMRFDCPICYHYAVGRSTRKIVQRMQGMKEEYDKINVRLGKLKHFQFSPSPAQWPQERIAVDRGREFMREFLKVLNEAAMGDCAGVKIFHAERKKHHDGTACENKSCTRRHKWEWGPHAHFVGYGFFQRSDNFYSKTGWVYKNIKDKGTDGRGSGYGTIYYLLTHCTVFTKINEDAISPSWSRIASGQHYSYVGLFANCKGGEVVLQKGLKQQFCEKCKSEILCYAPDPDGLPDLQEPIGIYELPFKIVRYYLNMKKKRNRQMEL